MGSSSGRVQQGQGRWCWEGRPGFKRLDDMGGTYSTITAHMSTQHQHPHGSRHQPVPGHSTCAIPPSKLNLLLPCAPPPPPAPLLQSANLLRLLYEWPWVVLPLLGVLSDRVPLGGGRWRPYLVAAGAAGGGGCGAVCAAQGVAGEAG